MSRPWKHPDSGVYELLALGSLDAHLSENDPEELATWSTILISRILTVIALRRPQT
jgi:hypothetical protein